MARRGLARRIGNLVGHLQFSDDQLQKTQRGLKEAGVAMPNFGNIGRELAKDLNEEPEEEPETEDERKELPKLPYLTKHSDNHSRARSLTSRVRRFNHCSSSCCESIPGSQGAGHAARSYAPCRTLCSEGTSYL